ncbi:HAD hydrolase-like protein [uncultured Roseobacter sp.]|uniref:HAD-IIA family hydrolase n=1 Tax=uncultured Roseobacter sp. TaxID=114847 RepID=UPI00261443CA|nr:HAD hydrolase-like protein [uncultured Roseobacter sp.]
MKTLSASEAFDAYEAVRARLPKAAEVRSAPRRIDTLADITEDFDVFLLDAFGVLNIGETTIAGTPERVRDLQAAGKRVLVVSNAASVPREVLLRKYKTLGYGFAPEDLVTSRMATIAGLTEMPDRLWGIMSLSAASLEDFGAMRSDFLGDDPAPYDRAEGFLLIGSGEWTEKRQDLLEAALTRHARPVVIANPDIIAPREHGFTTEPGFFAHRLAERTGVVPRFFGKPFADIYDLAFAALPPTDPSRIVMVGDSLHTDILGAHTAGIASVLISDFGFFANEEVSAAITRSGIVPDYIARRP